MSEKAGISSAGLKKPGEKGKKPDAGLLCGKAGNSKILQKCRQWCCFTENFRKNFVFS